MSLTTKRKIPEGFEPVPSRGLFFDENGPIWRKQGVANVPPVYGIMPELRHTNSLGFVHGGMIATFLDGAMAQSIYDTYQCRLVTLDLRISYRHVVPVGRWAEATIKLEDPAGGRLIATADLHCRGSVCALSQGEYQLFPNH